MCPLAAKTSDPKWQLLQIGLLREYLEIDMKPTDPVPFGFDGERAIDDFVLLTVLVGNDFIPHLPSLDIGEGAMDSLFKFYRCVHVCMYECVCVCVCVYVFELVGALFSVYTASPCRENLPRLGGYIMHEGTINFSRLEVLTSFMGSLEADTLSKREAEARKFARRDRGQYVMCDASCLYHCRISGHCSSY